ncbi:hypothetical protein [Escherichia coli]|uniref:hypothetical protein n=1 Tax=Escherichia coli TaxID=562 RepID=UPI0027DBA90F|nr:hypothetical protein [Escherichia coli]
MTYLSDIGCLEIQGASLTIMREYPNGETTHLTVMAAGFPSLTGDHKVIYVAADRHVTSEEILEAAMRLLN